jgi:hypothetical protein
MMLSSAGPETRRSAAGGDKKELFDEDYSAMARKIWDKGGLKEKGWRWVKGSGLSTNKFVFKNVRGGKQGCHWFLDDGEFGKGIEKYGLDHSPEDPNKQYLGLPVKERKSLKKIYAKLFPEIDADKKREGDSNSSHASNIEHGVKKKKRKNPSPAVVTAPTAGVVAAFPRVSMSPSSGGNGNAERVATSRSLNEAVGSSPGEASGHSPDTAASRSLDAGPAAEAVGYTTPVFNKDDVVYRLRVLGDLLKNESLLLEDFYRAGKIYTSLGVACAKLAAVKNVEHDLQMAIADEDYASATQLKNKRDLKRGQVMQALCEAEIEAKGGAPEVEREVKVCIKKEEDNSI